MIKKDITFIYSDSAEKAIYEPLSEEAKKRGYKVTLSDNPFVKCEIGVYCQHVNFPQYSKFSVIMLHDIIQQYSNWPDIWFNEPWNKYDVGVLPSDQWVKNWTAASSFYYTRPRKGVFKIGWPKADAIEKLNRADYREEFYQKYGLDLSRKTILYAPAWENDNKEDDFVKAMLTLGVNILIKQWDADPEKYPIQVENVKKMRELHKGIPNVTILPPETNIFVAIAAADILVSEESSTMCEATMMGIPAVSVSDWLIPDVVPSRLPKCDYDFVYTTQKAELSTTINRMLQNYAEYKAQTERFREANFSNIGNSSRLIMDIIDDCVCGREIELKSICPQRKKRLSLPRYIKHKTVQYKREAALNYSKNNKLFGCVWRMLKKVKKAVKRDSE